MKLHRNAKTTPTSRLELVRRTVDDGWRYQAVAEGYGVSVRTVAKWVQRFRQLGAAGLEDGSSRPQQTPHITSPVRVTFIRQLREQHGLPAWAIGRALRMPRSTVGAWLRGMNAANVAAKYGVSGSWARAVECLQRFSPAECRNCFRHCGYSIATQS